MKRYFYDEDTTELIVHEDNAIKILPCIAEDQPALEAPKPESKMVSVKEFLESKRKKKPGPKKQATSKDSRRTYMTEKNKGDILRLLAKGKNSEQIADELNFNLTSVNRVIKKDAEERGV
ncbi:MAG: hypothetical protein AB9866_18845 [Syntrophobacteraceae bacterium]